MGSRARSVLAWIDELEARPWLCEFADDVIADHRLAPGMVVLMAPQPLLPLDLNVLAGEDDADVDR